MFIKDIDNVSLQNLLAIVSRRKLAVFLPAAIVAIAFAAYAWYVPERYQAQTLIAVAPESNQLVTQAPTVEEQLWTVRNVLFNRSVIEQLIAEFNLDTEGEEGEDAVESVRSRIQIEVVSAKAFRVGFQGQDPAVVTLVANRLAELFVSETKHTQARTVAVSSGLLQKELQSLRQKLSSQSEQLRNYKQRVGGALPERLATNLKSIEVFDGRIQATTTAIAIDQATRAAAVKEMAELEKRGALDPAMSRDESSAQRKLAELRLDLARARAKYTERNPEVISLAREVADLEQAQPVAERGRAEPSAVSLRYVQLSAELTGIDQRLLSQRQELNSLTARLGSGLNAVASLPQHESELALLMRDYATTQESYQTLLARQTAAGAGDGLDKAGAGLLFTIAETARHPLKPYSPQRARIILMGLFGGLGLGSLVAFGAEHMNTSFVNARDLSTFTTLPVLTEVSSISKRNGGSTKAGRLVTVTQPTSVPAEQYYTLAAKVRQRCKGQSPVMLTVTSAMGGEGKTLTALNLSIALAQGSGEKVLLVDADLRRPMVHKYLGLDGSKRKGFGDLLLDPADDIHKYILSYNGVSVMPSYRPVANALGMLTSETAHTLLKRIGKNFPFVVVDSPPIVPIADGHALAHAADHVLLVVQARRTPRDLFKLAVESLDCSHLIGVALNRVNLKHSGYSSAYRYYQKHYQAKA